MSGAVSADVREFIVKKFPLARKQGVRDQDPLLESGMLDSQGVLELVTFIEEEFLVAVPDEDLTPENFQTIERISAYIASRTNSKG
jgi:acyl carrier protein